MSAKFLRFIVCCLLTVVLLFSLCGEVAVLLYPRPFSDVVAACADENQLSESLIYAVIRCESKFRPDARSSAGACGLMQLTPATFREVCGELGLPLLCDIFAPYENIRCGSFYLKKMLLRFPIETTALAAYNAGIGNVLSWLADPRYSSDGRTLHTIPFPETEAYVKRVLAAKSIYEKIYPQTGD